MRLTAINGVAPPSVGAVSTNSCPALCTLGCFIAGSRPVWPLVRKPVCIRNQPCVLILIIFFSLRALANTSSDLLGLTRCSKEIELADLGTYRFRNLREVA